MDFTYIATQTFGDGELEGELLTLFVAQGRRIIDALPDQDAVGQDQASHLLKGSAQAVGATAVVDAVGAYERARPGDRARARSAYRTLLVAFTDAETAIAAHLFAPR